MWGKVYFSVLISSISKSSHWRRNDSTPASGLLLSRESVFRGQRLRQHCSLWTWALTHRSLSRSCWRPAAHCSPHRTHNLVCEEGPVRNLERECHSCHTRESTAIYLYIYIEHWMKKLGKHEETISSVWTILAKSTLCWSPNVGLKPLGRGDLCLDGWP